MRSPTRQELATRFVGVVLASSLGTTAVAGCESSAPQAVPVTAPATETYTPPTPGQIAANNKETSELVKTYGAAYTNNVINLQYELGQPAQVLATLRHIVSFAAQLKLDTHNTSYTGFTPQQQHYYHFLDTSYDSELAGFKLTKLPSGLDPDFTAEYARYPYQEHPDVIAFANQEVQDNFAG